MLAPDSGRDLSELNGTRAITGGARLDWRAFALVAGAGIGTEDPLCHAAFAPGADAFAAGRAEVLLIIKGADRLIGRRRPRLFWLIGGGAIAS